jgi:hypothetical protein
MGRIWTKGFWKDAGERVFSTFLAVLLGLLLTDGFDWSSLQHWAFWAPVLTTTLVTLVKVLAAVVTNPTTGGSFGTSVPADGVLAIQDTKNSVVAGPGSPQEDGTPMQVTPLPGGGI